MIAGISAEKVVSFGSDIPAGPLSYSLNGIPQTPIEIPAGSLSMTIVIPAAINALAAGQMLGTTELQWSYPTATASITGAETYRLEATIPFAACAEGVRRKLGLDNRADLPDADIDLLKAYLNLQSQLITDQLVPFQTSNDYMQLQVVDAIEALAGLEVLPTLQVRLASSESSGTDSFQRLQNIDWSGVQIKLRALVDAVVLTLTPPFIADYSLMGVSVPRDLFPRCFFPQPPYPIF